MLMGGALDGIQVLGDFGEAKICNYCMTGVVHKYVWLAECQYGTEKFRTSTHSLEVSMNHITVMEVAEATSNIGCLESGVSVG